jgi:hypothetical protein
MHSNSKECLFHYENIAPEINLIRVSKTLAKAYNCGRVCHQHTQSTVLVEHHSLLERNAMKSARKLFMF